MPGWFIVVGLPTDRPSSTSFHRSPRSSHVSFTPGPNGTVPPNHSLRAFLVSVPIAPSSRREGEAARGNASIALFAKMYPFNCDENVGVVPAIPYVISPAFPGSWQNRCDVGTRMFPSTGVHTAPSHRANEPMPPLV